MPSNRPQPGDRPLPKKIGFLTQGAVFHPFTWADRVKILFGYRLLVRINLMSQHAPGQTQPVTEMRLTRETTQAGALREASIADNAAVKKNADKYAKDHAK